LSICTSIIFFVGRRINHRLAQAVYASIWEFLKYHCPSNTANFKRTWYGTITGTFILKQDEPIQALQISFVPLSRELGIEYPLSKLIKKIDRLYLLASLPVTPNFDMVFVSWDAHKLSSMIEKLTPVEAEDGSLDSKFKVYSSNPKEAIQFLKKSTIPKSPFPKELMVNRDNATIYLLCEAKPRLAQYALEMVFDLASFSTKKPKRKKRAQHTGTLYQ